MRLECAKILPKRTDKERIIVHIPELVFKFTGRRNVPEGLDQAEGGLKQKRCKTVLRQMLHKAGLK